MGGVIFGEWVNQHIDSCCRLVLVRGLPVPKIFFNILKNACGTLNFIR